MDCYQESLSGSTFGTKPSSSFSSTSSTLAGSRLLFGEIDSTSDQRMSASYQSLCSLVLSYNPLFARVWDSDACRAGVLLFLPRDDLANLRLVCHDFRTRLAPALFERLDITFTSRTFCRLAKLAALNRVGHLVKTMTFKVPHTPETQLPPLVDLCTGEEKQFVFPPQTLSSSKTSSGLRKPKYGDWETTDLLTKQYPPLFHAATNIDAFKRVLSSLTNVSHIRISCPAMGASHPTCSQRTIVDFALISLRIAVENASPDSLVALSLLDMHPRGLLCLSPLLGPGSNPASSRQWLRIASLSMQVHRPNRKYELDELRALHAYVRNFSRLVRFDFRWLDGSGPSPIPSTSSGLQKEQPREPSVIELPEHPASYQSSNYNSTGRKTRKSSTLFPLLTHLSIENATMSVSQIREVVSSHSHTLEDINLESIAITGGTWDQALDPLGDVAKNEKWKEAMEEMGDVPIMLAPSMVGAQKKTRLHSTTALQWVQDKVDTEKKCAMERGEHRKVRHDLASGGLSHQTGVVEEVRTILSNPTQPRKPKRKKRDLWTCHGVIRAVKGGFMGWR